MERAAHRPKTWGARLRAVPVGVWLVLTVVAFWPLYEVADGEASYPPEPFLWIGPYDPDPTSITTVGRLAAVGALLLALLGVALSVVGLRRWARGDSSVVIVFLYVLAILGALISTAGVWPYVTV